MEQFLQQFPISSPDPFKEWSKDSNRNQLEKLLCNVDHKIDEILNGANTFIKLAHGNLFKKYLNRDGKIKSIDAQRENEFGQIFNDIMSLIDSKENITDNIHNLLKLFKQITNINKNFMLLKTRCLISYLSKFNDYPELLPKIEEKQKYKSVLASQMISELKIDFNPSVYYFDFIENEWIYQVSRFLETFKDSIFQKSKADLQFYFGYNLNDLKKKLFQKINKLKIQ